ncbi:MAG: DUF3991 domain-containing protein [Oscillospiraceae bacterium]|nr:DUF3991 domain-containing protein [Oscillospiraceae bacterium]
MKEAPHFEPIPREQLLAARQADLPAYLMAQGVKLIPAGNQGSFRMAEHNSLFITGNKYVWNSRGESGNAIDFLRSYYGMDFREAVEALTAGGVEKKPIIQPPAAPERFDFAKLELAPNMGRVIDYLHHQRGLSAELITQLIRRRQLFEEIQHHDGKEYHNAVFPMYDGGAIVGAELNGTMPQQRFKGIKTGSKYGCGYNLSFGEQTAYALFFESAIDLLSFVDISRMRGKDLAGCRLTSLAGLKQNIFDHTMHSLGEQARPVLCVDNDEAGTAFVRSVQSVNAGVKIRQPAAGFKDWNDWLVALRSRQSQ